ncbi:hypothetical protein [Pseudoprimorskyibacter insulae]|nr:hypothetical protein [Pseudoprimorskyibacter insulae]
MTFLNILTKLPLLAHAAATVAAFVAFNQIKARLDALYAASRHPVDYATGQTTFDAGKIKSYYAQMQDFGTLDIYAATQRFDFLFILSMAAFGGCLATLVARASRPGTIGRNLGLAAGISLLTGCVMDVLENLISFALLANPQGFADWLALPYSAFAALKFAAITLAMGMVLASAVFAVVARLTRRTT